MPKFSFAPFRDVQFSGCKRVQKVAKIAKITDFRGARGSKLPIDG